MLMWVHESVTQPHKSLPFFKEKGFLFECKATFLRDGKPASVSLIQSTRLFIRISVLPSVEYDLCVIWQPLLWLTFIETKSSDLFNQASI